MIWLKGADCKEHGAVIHDGHAFIVAEWLASIGQSVG